MLVKNLRYEAGSAVHQPRPLHVHPVLPLVSPHSCVLRCVDGQRWGHIQELQAKSLPCLPR